MQGGEGREEGGGTKRAVSICRRTFIFTLILSAVDYMVQVSECTVLKF